MELHKIISRGKELLPLMCREHRNLFNQIVDYLREGNGDVADVNELEGLVEAYESYRQLGKRFIERNHVSL